MTIAAGDIKFYLSGGSGNTDPNASLGGAISTTEVSGTPLNNLFDNLSGAETLAGDTEYRCFYVKNTHGSLTAQSLYAWLSANTSSTNASYVMTIGLGTAGENGTEQTIANESTAPSGVTFSAAATEGAALSMGDVEAGNYYPLWVRRVVAPSATAVTAISFTATFGLDSAA